MNEPLEGRDGLSKASAHLEEIVALLKEPSGFSRLSPEQRKFVLAVVIASVVPADGKIKQCELEKLQSLLNTRMQTRGQTLHEALLLAQSGLGANPAIGISATRLADLLGIEDRCALIGMLWDIALCDYELHAKEEQLIYEIADKAGVPRKKVAEQQARAAANIS
jgi:uncharacterized tellurite resistance protein B-like protein